MLDRLRISSNFSLKYTFLLITLCLICQQSSVRNIRETIQPSPDNVFKSLFKHQFHFIRGGSTLKISILAQYNLRVFKRVYNFFKLKIAEYIF